MKKMRTMLAILLITMFFTGAVAAVHEIPTSEYIISGPLLSNTDPGAPYWDAPGYENVKTVVERTVNPKKYWKEHDELYTAPVRVKAEVITSTGEVAQKNIMTRADPGAPYWDAPGYENAKTVVDLVTDPEEFWARRATQSDIYRSYSSPLIDYSSSRALETYGSGGHLSVSYSSTYNEETISGSIIDDTTPFYITESIPFGGGTFSFSSFANIWP